MEENVQSEQESSVLFCFQLSLNEGGTVNGVWTQRERMCSNFAIMEHWKKKGGGPHAEWLADAREPDSLIKCDVVGRLSAFTTLHLSSDCSLIVQVRPIKKRNSCSFFSPASLLLFTTATLKAGTKKKKKSQKTSRLRTLSVIWMFPVQSYEANNWLTRSNGGIEN